MGTQLIRSGIGINETLAANLHSAALVTAIHRSYLDAGAEVIVTNTFGIADTVDKQECIEAGVALALQTARQYPARVAVLISLFPAAVTRYPSFVLRLQRCLNEWPSMFLLETATSLTDAVSAVEALKELRPDFIGATAHFRSDGRMPDGSTPEQAAISLIVAGADAVGANCGDDPFIFPWIAAQMRTVTDRTLIFRPSAGLPALTDGVFADAPDDKLQDKTQYVKDPRYPVDENAFCEIAQHLYQCGADVVGGCCGTGPKYIAAVVAAERMCSSIV